MNCSRNLLARVLLAFLLAVPCILAEDRAPVSKQTQDILDHLGEQQQFDSIPVPMNAAEMVRFYEPICNWHSNQAVLLAVKMTIAKPAIKDGLQRKYAEEAVRWKDAAAILRLAQAWVSKPASSDYYIRSIRKAQVKLAGDLAAAKAHMAEEAAQRSYQSFMANQSMEIKRRDFLNHVSDWFVWVMLFPIPFLFLCSGAWVSQLLHKQRRWLQLGLNGALALGITAYGAFYSVADGISFNLPHHTLRDVLSMTVLFGAFLALHLWAYLDRSKTPPAPWKKAACILLSGGGLAWMVFGWVKLVLVPGLAH